MNINQYTNRIIQSLQNTQVNDCRSIWDIIINDKKINDGDISEINIELIDTVFIVDIKKMSQVEILDLWRHTEHCYTHESSSPFMTESKEYDGDIVQDIKNEIIELILCDIKMLY